MDRRRYAVAGAKSFRTVQVHDDDLRDLIMIPDGSPCAGLEFKVPNVKRYYFHLVDGDEIILDRDGVDVADLAAARAEVIKAICEFQRECPNAAADWTDWRIEITDASGATALTVDLSDLAEIERERKLLN